MPAVRALDDPTTRFAANAADHPLLTASADVRDAPALADLLLAVGVVVPFVEADVLGPPRPARRPEYAGVHGRADHPLVVDVGTGDGDRERNSAGVCQNVALGAEFPAIGGVGAREVPPFGAFTDALSIEHQLKSTPTSWS